MKKLLLATVLLIFCFASQAQINRSFTSEKSLQKHRLTAYTPDWVYEVAIVGGIGTVIGTTATLAIYDYDIGTSVGMGVVFGLSAISCYYFGFDPILYCFKHPPKLPSGTLTALQLEPSGNGLSLKLKF